MTPWTTTVPATTELSGKTHVTRFSHKNNFHQRQGLSHHPPSEFGMRSTRLTTSSAVYSVPLCSGFPYYGSKHYIFIRSTI